MNKISFMLISVLLILALAACGSTKDQGNKESSGSDNNTGAQKTFAVVSSLAGNPYCVKETEGFRDAVVELGHKVIIKAPDQPTAEAQIQMIEELISQKVDSITVLANDFDALSPALKKAIGQGIKVQSVDSAVNAKSRLLHVNQADSERIGRVEIEAISEMIGGKGQIAVLSGTSQAANSNEWIDWMKKELEDPKYKDIELVKVVYGDDLRDKSVSETEALLKSYPDLKGIISPTTVGIAAAGKVLTDKGLKGKVQLTGLGLPSEMAEYIENGVSQWMYLWNPIDLGYLAGHSAVALVDGTITGAIGDKFTAGKLGEVIVIKDGEGTQIILGDPFKYDINNIGEWKAMF